MAQSDTAGFDVMQRSCGEYNTTIDAEQSSSRESEQEAELGQQLILVTSQGERHLSLVPTAGRRGFFDQPGVLAEFFDHVRNGEVRVLGVSDFPYKDGTAEREVWLLDTTQTRPDGSIDADRAYVIMHAHLASEWESDQRRQIILRGKKRKRKGKGGQLGIVQIIQEITSRDWSRITQLNFRHSSATTPFSHSNEAFGQRRRFVTARGDRIEFGQGDVHPVHGCRWAEGSKAGGGLAVLRSKGQGHGHLIRNQKTNNMMERSG